MVHKELGNCHSCPHKRKNKLHKLTINDFSYIHQRNDVKGQTVTSKTRVLEVILIEVLNWQFGEFESQNSWEVGIKFPLPFEKDLKITCSPSSGDLKNSSHEQLLS